MKFLVCFSIIRSEYEPEIIYSVSLSKNSVSLLKNNVFSKTKNVKYRCNKFADDCFWILLKFKSLTCAFVGSFKMFLRKIKKSIHFSRFLNYQFCSCMITSELSPSIFRLVWWLLSFHVVLSNLN